MGRSYSSFGIKRDLQGNFSRNHRLEPGRKVIFPFCKASCKHTLSFFDEKWSVDTSGCDNFVSEDKVY